MMQTLASRWQFPTSQGLQMQIIGKNGQQRHVTTAVDESKKTVVSFRVMALLRTRRMMLAGNVPWRLRTSKSQILLGSSLTRLRFRQSGRSTLAGEQGIENVVHVMTDWNAVGPLKALEAQSTTEFD
jgi:hypothetical protein